MFNRLTHNIKRHYTKFVGNTLPGAIKRGTSFLGNFIPHAQLAHRIIRGAHETISKSDVVDPKVKSAAGHVHDFAQVGLQKLEGLHARGQAYA